MSSFIFYEANFSKQVSEQVQYILWKCFTAYTEKCSKDCRFEMKNASKNSLPLLLSALIHCYLLQASRLYLREVHEKLRFFPRIHIILPSFHR